MLGGLYEDCLCLSRATALDVMQAKATTQQEKDRLPFAVSFT